MADTPVLEAGAVRRGGSSPLLGTISISAPRTETLRHEGIADPCLDD